jgi:hypothetical protein
MEHLSASFQSAEGITFSGKANRWGPVLEFYESLIEPMFGTTRQETNLYL